MTHTDSEDADTFWACVRKKAYPSEDIAKLSVAAIVRSQPLAETRAYACRRCGLWHVGATPPSERKVLTFSDEDAVSPRQRARPPRRRSYGDSSVRRPRSYGKRYDEDDDDDDSD